MPVPAEVRKQLGLSPVAVGGAETLESKGDSEPATPTVTALALPAALPLPTAPTLSVATTSGSAPMSVTKPAQLVITAGPTAPPLSAPSAVIITHASGTEPAVASSSAETSNEASMASFVHALRVAPALKRHPSQSRKSKTKTKFQVEKKILPPLPSSGSSSEKEEEEETSAAGSEKAASRVLHILRCCHKSRLRLWELLGRDPDII
ncbi:hypothetical protein BTVI_01356 [Pitangus sulphuratus]|nr:hypothetical protein BTVI_01356 [Pitangus sulphuratus]